MVEPDGSWMDKEKALGILDAMDLEIIEEEITPKLLEALEVAKEQALPLRRGRR